MKARAAVATGEPAVAPKGVGSSTFATAEQGALGDLARVVQSSAYPRLANPQVSLTFESQKQVSQNVIDVTFEQLDRYDYEYEGGRTPTEGEPTFIAEKYPRVVQFELVNGSWKVSKTHAQTAARPELEPPENFTSTTINAPDMGGAPVNAQTEDAASNVTPQPQSNAAAATTRSRAKFRDYALKHAYNYNPSYRDFGGILSGGDCTNFVSQALRHGGFSYWSYGKSPTSNGVWWYNHDGSDSWSHSWTVANNFYWFSRNSGRATVVSSVNDLLWGDVVQINFQPQSNSTLDHTLAVTAKSNGVIYVSSHTSDYANKRMGQVMADNPGAWYSRLKFRYT